MHFFLAASDERGTAGGGEGEESGGKGGLRVLATTEEGMASIIRKRVLRYNKLSGDFSADSRKKGR